MQNLKEYISLQLRGGFPLEYIKQNSFHIGGEVFNAYVHEQLEVFGLTETTLQSKTVFFQLLCHLRCNLLGPVKLSGTSKARGELLLQNVIWNSCLLLWYVKQTASPYSLMINCFMTLFDTIPAVSDGSQTLC